MYEDFINEINKNNGIITSKEALEKGISRTALKNMTDKKILNRIEYGIYVTDKFVYDEFYIFQLKHKNIVFSYNTALYLLEMSERTPVRLDVTTSRNNSLGYCKSKINIYRVNKEILELGKIKVKTPFGNVVNSYNKERTVCDIINNKTNIDFEIANKSIKKCIRSNDFDADEMFEYAKKIKIYDKVKNYMEAIIW